MGIISYYCITTSHLISHITVGKPIARPTLITSAEDKERTVALGEGDGQQGSIASVVFGKRVAQKLGAPNYIMVCTTHPWSVDEFFRLCTTLCSIYFCRFWLISRTMWVILMCIPYWLLQSAHHVCGKECAS